MSSLYIKDDAKFLPSLGLGDDAGVDDTSPEGKAPSLVLAKKSVIGLHPVKTKTFIVTFINHKQPQYV